MNAQAQALAVLISPKSGKVIRKVLIRTFDEAKDLTVRFPNCDLGLFLDGAPDGDMWCYWPEFDPSRRRWV